MPNQTSVSSLNLPDSLLGKKFAYPSTYDASWLFPVSRSIARDMIGIKTPLPFSGFDHWTGYELSWLNSKGKPMVAIADFIFPCESKHIVESKSFKLYLNSFNQTKFDSLQEVKEVLSKDLNNCIGVSVNVRVYSIDENNQTALANFSGKCLDDLDIDFNCYELNPEFLKTGKKYAEETVYSHLLKSNCLATGQPDWGSVLIKYAGPQINHADLLRYIVSFRNHAGFNEHCIEQMYYDILHRCKPEKLSIYGRYTRRGGLDINPYRTNFPDNPSSIRLLRQ